MSLMSRLIDLAETGWLPDWAIRTGIRHIVRQRYHELEQASCEKELAEFQAFLSKCAQSAIAVAPVESNRQHYEVPTKFFQKALGPRMKYSSCYWEPQTRTLAQAEELALAQTCQHAELSDGMDILELGCGWGSLSLWMAEKYPHARITAVSHSASQRQYITSRAEQAGFRNLQVVTADINAFATQLKYDRVVSVEMFEHVRNHQELFRRIASWLNDDGKLFCHIFCHRRQAYFYESQGPGDWMTDYFFAGGVMPSDSLFTHYQRDLRLEQQWRWNGTHYQKTSDAWLANVDQHHDEVLTDMVEIYGRETAPRWLQRWRMFFMACAEMFGYQQGNAWYVSHYLFSRQHSPAGLMSLPLPAGMVQGTDLSPASLS